MDRLYADDRGRPVWERTIADADGFAITFASPYGPNDLAEKERKLRARAKLLGCKLREIPFLRSTYTGPFHPSYDVTVEDGIVRSYRVIPEKMPAPIVHAIAVENRGFIKATAVCGEIVMGPDCGGNSVAYDDRARATCPSCRGN